MPANNRLTYTGAGTQIFKVTANVYCTPATTTSTSTFALALNGTAIAATKEAGTGPSLGGGGFQQISTSYIISLTTNDYVEVFATNSSSSTTLTATYLTLVAVSVGGTGASGTSGQAGPTGVSGTSGTSGASGAGGGQTPWAQDINGGGHTLSSARITRRLNTVASSATPTINTDTTDIFIITALAANITSMTTNLSGTPNNGDTLEIRITDNGTARTIAWGTKFGSTSILLPATTIINTPLRVLLEWNADLGTPIFQCIGVS
jgi:hypothetical protein